MTQHNTVYRASYRGQLKPQCTPQAIYDMSSSVFETLTRKAEKGSYLTAGLYQFGTMLFSFWETVDVQPDPNVVFAPFAQWLMDWPGEEYTRKWIPMRTVYYQQIPKNADDWERRKAPCAHIGRLARLISPLAGEYTYYHYALVEEGLHKGDRYQFISMHEDYLFSYYEEPRTNVNVKRVDAPESQVIRQWREADPAAHFYRFYPNAPDFIHLPALFIVQRQAGRLFTAPPLRPD